MGYESGMKTLFVLALRNIVRNKRRTYLTGASIAFAVFFSAFMHSFQKGAWDNILNNMIQRQTGYIQIQSKGYYEDPTLDKMFSGEEIPNLTTRFPVKTVHKRIETFALAASEKETRGVMILAGNLAEELAQNGIHEKIVAGNGRDSSGVIIGTLIAQWLHLGVGDSLVLLTQGYRGANAAGVFRVMGIVDLGIPDLNKMQVYMNWNEAAKFLAAENLVTSLVLVPENNRKSRELKTELQAGIDTTKFDIKHWDELIPELVEARSLDDAGTRVIQALLYAIVAFGIFGTLLMMMKERQFENGVLISLGMKREWLGAVIWMETMFLGFFGSLIGCLMAIFPVYWFYKNPIRFEGEYAKAYENFGMEPIIPTDFSWEIFAWQFVVIFGVVTVLSLVPLRKIFVLNPVQAMRRL
jgi:putative ABC transport system permease protein